MAGKYDVVTSDILDGLVDMMPGTTYTPKHAPSVTPIKKPSMAPVDVERILQELEERLEKPVPAKAKPNKSPFARLSGLKRPRLNLTMPGSMSNKARIEVANDLPDLPQPMLGEAQMIRQALYNKKAGSNHHSTELRLATHALNVTVLVIALPVGALMMAYSIVRGENIHASARMLAIVGMFAGLQVTPVGAQIMSMI